ncbi:MAG TPA: hypothetical protein VFK86_10930, partial [Bauldia sp.]|nr:hypothetical protein [Bauldia sp.]
RVQNLRTHFAQANKDIEAITVSSGKIAKKGGEIAAVEIEEERPIPKSPPAANSDGPPELPFHRYGA